MTQDETYGIPLPEQMDEFDTSNLPTIEIAGVTIPIIDTHYLDLEQREILNIQRMPDYGYELRKTRYTYPGRPTITLLSAYNLKGDYIGNSEDAYFLCRKMEIKPELIVVGKNTCSIGFCKKENKWYGWSHRAICGFTIGDVVKEGDCTNSSGFIEEYLIAHPEKDLSLHIGFKAETMDDAKRMAIAFADSVS